MSRRSKKSLKNKIKALKKRAATRKAQKAAGFIY